MAFHRASENSFRTYMQQKNEKLYEQFEEQQQAAGGEQESIFKGVCIFVNGFTRPSHLVGRPITTTCRCLHHWRAWPSVRHTSSAGAKTDHGEVRRFLCKLHEQRCHTHHLRQSAGLQAQAQGKGEREVGVMTRTPTCDMVAHDLRLCKRALR